LQNLFYTQKVIRGHTSHFELQPQKILWIIVILHYYMILSQKNQLSPVSVRSITHTAWGQNCCSGRTMVHTAGVRVLRLCPGWHMLGWEEIHCKEKKRELYPV